MLQTEKFRAVADLTSGVAHNFNNLLQIVIGNASLGLMNLQSADFIHLKENLTRIAESARFGAETVRRLNRYARSRDDVRAGETEVFDLSDLVRQAAEMTRHWWKTEPERKGLRVSLDTRVKTGCTIRGNKTEIFEVVVNLIKNAVEALPLGGDIEIDTGMEENMVVLKVRDNGTGIPRENLSRLFTPFFTTHVDAGRGLGLATTRTIIDSHGGQILVESAEGQGSTFTVTLPLVIERPVPQAQAEENGTDMVLNILAVDDLEATLKMMKAGLEAFGHTVFTAVSGDDAVKIFSNNEIDLVICDLGMPGMNGWQVGSSVTKIRREKGTAKAAFIILTGWDEQAQEDEKIKESGVDAVVRKPIDITRLMKVIREVMARERYGQR